MLQFQHFFSLSCRDKKIMISQSQRKFISVVIKSSKTMNNKTNLGINRKIKLPNINKVQFTYTAVYIKINNAEI